MIDSHAHITSDALFPHVDTLLARAKGGGMHALINICTDIVTLERGLELSRRYPWVYNTAATTPHDVDAEGEAVFPVVAACAKAGSLVAIGETGLDYFHHHSAKETQQKFLRRYLQLALETKLPVVIHCREAFADFFQILDEEYVVQGKHAPGVLHCFTGTRREAESVIERGWYLSLSGIVTFKKSLELQEVAKHVPLDQLLIETDSPYLAPQSKRGHPNEPSYLSETAAFIAQLKGVAVENLIQATANNTKKLFKLNL